MSSSAPKEKQRCRRERLLLGTLYLVGIVHWIGFFYLVYPEGGDRSFVNGRALSEPLFVYRSFKAYDWVKETQLLQVLQDALRTRTVPFHSPELERLVVVPEGGNRFLGFPAIPRSPQIVLLYMLDPVTFVFVNLLLMYSLGFYGCLLLRRHYNLGLIPFVFLFFLFNLNGYFVEKFTGYGSGLLGYFLLPFVVLAMFRASELHEMDRIYQAHNGAVLGLALAGIQYQGTFHLFVELITFVLIWGVVNYKMWRVTLISLLTAFAATAVILLPAVITYGAGSAHAMQGGYRRPEWYVEALVITRNGLCDRFFWPELSLYVGLVGLLAIVYFALWAPFMRLEWTRFRGWSALALPCIVLTFMSYRLWRAYILPNWIPLLNAESLTTRYMIIPLLITVVIAAVNLDGFLKKYWGWRRVRWLSFSALAVIAMSLVNHSRVWRMHRVHGEFDSVVRQGLCGEVPDPTWQIVARIQNNMGDSLYIASFWLGLAISLFALVLVGGWLAMRWSRSRAAAL